MTDVSLAGMPAAEVVRKAEAFLESLPQVDLGTQHLVHGKCSVRTVFIPAGCHVTGALTNLPNVVILHGDITATTDAGPQRFTGFHVIPANPGAKRYVVAHADTWWTTVHYTEQTDIAAIEDEMTDEASRLQTRRAEIEFRPCVAVEG